MQASPLIADLLRAGRPVRFRVRGSSMGETIRTGDVVEVEPVSAPQLWRGDIVLFERHGRLVAHRLIGTVSDAGLTCLLFRGDNHNGSDGVVPTQAVLGRVSHVERHIPNLVRALGRRVFGLFSN